MSFHLFQNPNDTPCHYLKLFYVINLKIQDLTLNIISSIFHALTLTKKTICLFKVFIVYLLTLTKSTLRINFTVFLHSICLPRPKFGLFLVPTFFAFQTLFKKCSCPLGHDQSLKRLTVCAVLNMFSLDFFIPNYLLHEPLKCVVAIPQGFLLSIVFTLRILLE